MTQLSWPFVSLLVMVIAHTGDPPPSSPPASDPLPAPAKILDSWYAAGGGPALLKIQVERRTGTLLRGKTGKVPLETVAASGRWLYHQTFAFGGQVRYGFDGTQGWIQDTDGVQSMDPPQRHDLHLLLDPRAPARARELYPNAEVTGTERVGDREAYTVRAVLPEGIATELAFDRATGLLVRAGGMTFEDYRDVDGIKRPFRVLLGLTDEETHLQMVLEFADAKHEPEAEESGFRRPDQKLPFTEAPLYRVRKDIEVSPEAMDACAGVYQHPEHADVTYTVRRWQNHLMIERTGWRREVEIKPESEVDYFIRFPGIDFHFDRDQTGRVTSLVIRSDRTIRAERIR